MQKLDPKTVWLFFLSDSIASLSTLLLVSVLRLFNQLSIFTFTIVVVIIILKIPFSYIIAKLRYNNFTFELTNDSIIIEKGVIWKKKSSIPFVKIQNIDIIRGPIVRILGLSDLQIQTAGYSGYTGNRHDSSGSEGRLPGLSVSQAEKLREILVKQAKEAI